MKRITFITGHYGSGKSEFSINLAIRKKIQNIVDLDIVNPYFRSREVEELLKSYNINVISSSLENALGSDLPYIDKQAFLPLYNNESVIYDLGGDPVGARLIRQFVEELPKEEVDLLLCINVYREQTSTSDKIIKMIKDIEASGGLKVTGLINNSNFLRNTVYDDLLIGEKIILKVCEDTNLNIVYTGVYEKIIENCEGLQGEVIPLKLFLRKKWL